MYFLLQRCLGVSYFSLQLVYLDICTLDSIVDEGTFSFLYYGLFKCIAFPLDLQSFGVTLFARHLRLKILAVLDLASCISNFFNFLDKCERIHD